MVEDRKICIMGAGGFGREVLACICDLFESKGFSVDGNIAFLVSDEMCDADELLGIRIMKLSDFDPASHAVVIAIGDPTSRRMAVGQLPESTRFATVVHPAAIISKWVQLGEGSIVTAGSILTTNISIGRHAHVNLNTTIGHDCVLGDFCTMAPAVNLSGKCKIGNDVYFGTNAAVRQGIHVCDNVTIGMGGVVVKNIAEPGTYVCNPVVKLKAS